MINVDISNVWCALSLPDLLNAEREIAAAHYALADGTGAGKEYLKWMDLPHAETRRIRAAAERIRGESDVCVVVGMGGSIPGIRGAMELLQGADRNLTEKPRIFFAGDTLSTRAWNALTAQLEGKDFSVIAISEGPDAAGPAIALRNLRWLLERRYGTDRAKKRIFAVTDARWGALRQQAADEGWETFLIGAGVPDRFGILSPAGLLPMAVAGIDIDRVLAGAREAKENYDNLRSLENPVWLYAGLRSLLQRSGAGTELLCAFEPDFQAMGLWWQQLFGACPGLLTQCVPFPGVLGGLDGLIRQSRGKLFETLLRFDAPSKTLTVGRDLRDPAGVNRLADKRLDEVAEMAFQGIVDDHSRSDVPMIVMDLGELSDEKLGELFYFLQLSCGICAYMAQTDPFTPAGPPAYERDLLEPATGTGF